MPAKRPRSPKGSSSPNPSPRKSPRKAPTQPAAPIDKSTWPASKIPVGTTINKTKAMKIYHLKQEDMTGLKFETAESNNMHGGATRPMFLYQERDVEHKAWEKYGGPLGFQSMLDIAREKYNKKANQKEPFPEPSDRYDSTPTPTAGPSALPAVDESRYIGRSPSLRKLKQALQREGNEWLWKAIIDACEGIDGPYARDEKEAVVLSTNQDFIWRYPRRSDPQDPEMLDSASFTALRDILARALVWSNEFLSNGKHVDFDVDGGSFGDFEDKPDWKAPFYTEIYDAFSGIIAEHGVAGWEQARWLVYDRYAQCNLCPISYTRDGIDYLWCDEGNRWFQPLEYKNIDKEKKAALLKSLHIENDRYVVKKYYNILD